MQQDTAIKVLAHLCYFAETITTIFMHIKDFHVTNFISYIYDSLILKDSQTSFTSLTLFDNLDPLNKTLYS